MAAGPFPQIPSLLDLVLRNIWYAAAAVIGALGGIHGTRYFRGIPAAPKVEAEVLRDELVFGDEDAKLLDGDEIDKDPTLHIPAKMLRKRPDGSLPDLSEN